MAMDLRFKQQETNVCICICIYIYTVYVYYNCVYIGNPIYIYIIIYIYVIQYTHMGNVSKKSLVSPGVFLRRAAGKLARELGWDPAAARREPLWWRDQAPRQIAMGPWHNGRPMGSWFASAECVSLSYKVIYIYICISVSSSLSSSLFSHVICIFIILHHKKLLLLTRQWKSFVWLEVYRQNSSWSLDQTLCHLAYDFYMLKPSFCFACFSQNGIYTPFDGFLNGICKG